MRSGSVYSKELLFNLHPLLLIPVMCQLKKMAEVENRSALFETSGAAFIGVLSFVSQSNGGGEKLKAKVDCVYSASRYGETSSSIGAM